MLPLWTATEPYLKLLAITFLPYIELRGSIPVGIGLGMDPLLVFSVCTAANIAIILPIFLFLDYLFEGLFRIRWVERHFRGKVERIKDSGKRRVERLGLIGLAAFVAVPLPGTGAYTGCLAAYLLGMDRKRSGAAIALGVFTAGVLVTLAAVGALSFFRFLK